MAVMLRDHTNISSGALDARATSLANEAKIAHALFTGIVKDKIGYPVREYAKNAWEVSPADRPFEIDLPGRWSPKIRFRDYGPGLDHEFIMERYATSVIRPRTRMASAASRAGALARSRRSLT